MLLKYTANEYLPNKFFSHFKVLYIILPNFYFTSNKVILLNMDRNKKNRVQISKEIKKKFVRTKEMNLLLVVYSLQEDIIFLNKQ